MRGPYLGCRRRPRPGGQSHLTIIPSAVSLQEPDYSTRLRTPGVDRKRVELGRKPCAQGALGQRVHHRVPADGQAVYDPLARSWTPQMTPWEPSNGPRFWGCPILSQHLMTMPSPAPQVRPRLGRPKGILGRAGAWSHYGLCAQEPHLHLHLVLVAHHCCLLPGPP